MGTKWFPLSRTLWFNAAALGVILLTQGVGASELSSAMGAAGLGSLIPLVNLGLRFFKTHEGVGSGGKFALSSWTILFNLALFALGGYLVFTGASAVLGSALVIYGAVNIWLRIRTNQGLRLAPWGG